MVDVVPLLVDVAVAVVLGRVLDVLVLVGAVVDHGVVVVVPLSLSRVSRSAAAAPPPASTTTAATMPMIRPVVRRRGGLGGPHPGAGPLGGDHAALPDGARHSASPGGTRGPAPPGVMCGPTAPAETGATTVVGSDGEEREASVGDCSGAPQFLQKRLPSGASVPQRLQIMRFPLSPAELPPPPVARPFVSGPPPTATSSWAV